MIPLRPATSRANVRCSSSMSGGLPSTTSANIGDPFSACVRIPQPVVMITGVAGNSPHRPGHLPPIHVGPPGR